MASSRSSYRSRSEAVARAKALKTHAWQLPFGSYYVGSRSEALAYIRAQTKMRFGPPKKQRSRPQAHKRKGAKAHKHRQSLQAKIDAFMTSLSKRERAKVEISFTTTPRKERDEGGAEEGAPSRPPPPQKRKGRETGRPMNKALQIHNIKRELERRGIASDTVDVEALVDPTLTLEENKAEILAQLPVKRAREEVTITVKQTQTGEEKLQEEACGSALESCKEGMPGACEAYKDEGCRPPLEEALAVGGGDDGGLLSEFI